MRDQQSRNGRFPAFAGTVSLSYPTRWNRSSLRSETLYKSISSLK